MRDKINVKIVFSKQASKSTLDFYYKKPGHKTTRKTEIKRKKIFMNLRNRKCNQIDVIINNNYFEV